MDVMSREEGIQAVIIVIMMMIIILIAPLILWNLIDTQGGIDWFLSIHLSSMVYLRWPPCFDVKLAAADNRL